MVPSKRQAERKKQLASKQPQLLTPQGAVPTSSSSSDQKVSSPSLLNTSVTSGSSSASGGACCNNTPTTTTTTSLSSPIPSSAAVSSGVSSNSSVGVKPRPDNKRSVPVDCECGAVHSTNSIPSEDQQQQLLQHKMPLHQAASIKQQLLQPPIAGTPGMPPLNSGQRSNAEMRQLLAAQNNIQKQMAPSISTTSQTGWDLPCTLNTNGSGVANSAAVNQAGINPYFASPLSASALEAAAASVTNKKKKPQRNAKQLQQSLANQQILAQQQVQGQQMLQQLQQHHHHLQNATEDNMALLHEQMQNAHALSGHSIDPNTLGAYPNTSLRGSVPCALSTCGLVGLTTTVMYSRPTMWRAPLPHRHHPLTPVSF